MGAGRITAAAQQQLENLLANTGGDIYPGFCDPSQTWGQRSLLSLSTVAFLRSLKINHNDYDLLSIYPVPSHLKKLCLIFTSVLRDREDKSAQEDSLLVHAPPAVRE